LTLNRFFIKDSNIHSSYILLDGDEHHYLSKVARIKPKKTVWLFDANNIDYLARVEEIGKNDTRL